VKAEAKAKAKAKVKAEAKAEGFWMVAELLVLSRMC